MLARRLAVFATAYLSASAVAAAIIMVGAVSAFESRAGIGEILSALLSELTYRPSMFGFATGIVALLALLPTLVVVLFLSRAGIHSPRWYVVMGILVGLMVLGTYYALLTLLRWTDGSTRPTPPLNFSDPQVAHAAIAVVTSVVLAGGCGGLIYWVIAGRHVRSRSARLPAALD
jgi:hypothetical protein